jgi:hypothetical protein
MALAVSTYYMLAKKSSNLKEIETEYINQCGPKK